MIIATETFTGTRVAARSAEKGQDYRCPACSAAPLVLKRGTLVVPHFAHPAGGSCDSEPESWEHLEGKELLADHFEGDLEVPIRTWTHRRRGDILCGPPLVRSMILEFDTTPDTRWSEHEGDFRDERDAWIIEYQCSRLTFADWRDRTTDYNIAGYPVLWVWGTDRNPAWYQSVPTYRLDDALHTATSSLEVVLHYGAWILV